MDRDRNNFLINAPESGTARVQVQDHSRKLRQRIFYLTLQTAPTAWVPPLCVHTRTRWRHWELSLSFPENYGVNPGSRLTSDIETMTLPDGEVQRGKQHSLRHLPR